MKSRFDNLPQKRVSGTIGREKVPQNDFLVVKRAKPYKHSSTTKCMKKYRLSFEPDTLDILFDNSSKSYVQVWSRIGIPETEDPDLPVMTCTDLKDGHNIQYKSVILMLSKTIRERSRMFLNLN